MCVCVGKQLGYQGYEALEPLSIWAVVPPLDGFRAKRSRAKNTLISGILVSTRRVELKQEACRTSPKFRQLVRFRFGALMEP